MNFIAKQKSLTAGQRKEAKTAAKLLKTGKLADQGTPSWFKKSVSLGADSDATSVANIKAGIKGMEAINDARKGVKARSLRVSPIMLAISMIDADYQKKGEIAHPHFYDYANNLENIAAGGDPIRLWMREKSAWQYDVKKSPSIAKDEYHPNWHSKAYSEAVLGTNGYQEAGHYTNLINRDHRAMGAAHMTNNSKYDYVDVMNATSENGKNALSMSQYKKLVNKWLK